MQPEAINRHSHCKEGTAATGPSRARLLLSGLSGPRLARHPFQVSPLPRPSPGPISVSGLSWHGLARRPSSLHSCSLQSVASVSRRWARSRLASETPRSPAPGALLVWHLAACVDSISALTASISLSDFLRLPSRSFQSCTSRLQPRPQIQTPAAQSGSTFPKMSLKRTLGG